MAIEIATVSNTPPASPRHGGVPEVSRHERVWLSPLALIVLLTMALGVTTLVSLATGAVSISPRTIFAAMLAGMTLRPAATEFAFIVGIPVMFAATAFELLKARHDLGGADWSDLGLGFVVSGIVAFIVVKWLLRYVQSHRFTVFAWYRIVLGIALLAMLHQGYVH